MEESSKMFRNEKERDAFFRRRVQKMMKHQVPRGTPQEFFEDALRVDDEDAHFPYSVKNLAPLACQGSMTAQKLLNSTTVNHNCQRFAQMQFSFWAI